MEGNGKYGFWTYKGLQGSGCRPCANKRVGKKNIKYTLKDYQDYAKKNNGKFLSKKIGTAKKKYKWLCENGHPFTAEGNILTRKTWCSYCAGVAPLSIKQVRETGKLKNLKLLSKEYKNTKSLLLWKCKSCKLEFEKSYQQLSHKDKKGGCPECSSLIGEALCRVAFEAIFKNRFPKSYPVWLKNVDGPRELDGYCKKLEIAFEHQGLFHKELSYFNQYSSEKLQQIKRYDRAKRNACKKNGVTLIEIDEVLLKTPLEKLESVIISKCKKAGVKNLPNVGDMNIDYSKAYVKVDALEDYKKLAKTKNIIVKSKSWRGSSTKLKHQCKICKYNYESAPANMMNSDSGCPKCGRKEAAIKRQVPVREINKRLKANNLKLIGEYISNTKRSKVICTKCKTEHNPLMGNAMNSFVCKVCEQIDKDRELYREVKQLKVEIISFKRNIGPAKDVKVIGKCLSCKKKITTTLRNLRANGGCPDCNTKKYKDEQLSRVTKELKKLGLKPLSKYKDSKTIMKFECKTKGHIFKRSYAVIRGKGCVECRKEVRGMKRVLSNEYVKKELLKRGFELKSKFVKSSIKIKVRCKTCKDYWTVGWGKIQQGRTCPTCNKLNKSKK